MAYKKPLHGSVVDTDNPLSALLSSCFLFTEGSGNAVDITASPITIVNPTWQSAGQACGPYIVDGNTIPKLNWSAGPFSVAIWVRCIVIPGNADFPTLYGRSVYINEGNNQGWEIQCEAANQGQILSICFKVFRNNSYGNYVQKVSNQVVAGTDYFIAVTSDGFTRIGYLNGVEYSRTTSNAVPLPASGASCFFKNGGNPAQMPLLQACTWNRWLSKYDIQALQGDNLIFIKPGGITTNPRERLTQSDIETIIDSTGGTVRDSQNAIESIVDLSTGTILDTQNVLEIPGDFVADYWSIRDTQNVIEVVCNTLEGENVVGRGGVIATADFVSKGTVS